MIYPDWLRANSIYPAWLGAQDLVTHIWLLQHETRTIQLSDDVISFILSQERVSESTDFEFKKYILCDDFIYTVIEEEQRLIMVSKV
jgi:hypothetical protein